MLTTANLNMKLSSLCKRLNINSFKSNYQNYKDQKFVSTWSPLAVAFNTKYQPNFIDNFKAVTGAFGIDSLSSEIGLYALKERAIADVNKLLREILDPKRCRNAVQICDDLSDTICQVADLAEFIRMMHPSSLYAESAEDACCAMSNLVEKLNTNRDLYNTLKSAVENGDINQMTEEEKHVGRLFLFDFEQCGIHLSEEQRKVVVNYNDYILQLGQRFMTHAAAPAIIDPSTIPEEMHKHFKQEGNNFVINGFSDFSDEAAREIAYKHYHMPDLKQEHVLNELLLYRQKLADKCGFPTYAHRAVKGSTAGDPEFVIKFLDHLNNSLAKWTDADFMVLKTIKQLKTQKPIAMWDIAHLTHNAKQYYVRSSEEEFSPYFSVGTCMDGLNNLFNSLFGISLVNTPLDRGEAWAEDVYKLAVMDENKELLGYIYCDFFERRGKPNQDCHFTIRGGRRLKDGSYQNPIVVVTLSFPPPSKEIPEKPSLLTPNMVENLFHEMGHAIHSMLGRAQYQHVTGTRCATDFAEVPSILMESFCSDPRVLRTFAKHYETKETMPEDMMERLNVCKVIMNAIEVQTQVFYSALDYQYHVDCNASGHTTEILKKVQETYYRLPFVENTAWQLRFSHLVGYGAKYYSYLLSKAIATTIWKKYFKHDPFSRSSGEKYLKECLAYGGSKPSQLLVKDFLDVHITPESLATPLIEDAEEKFMIVHTPTVVEE